MVERRLTGGAWITLDTGVYALASSTARWERQLTAALLSRPGSVAAGGSAAHLHRFNGFGPGRPVILIPFTGNARSPIARIIRSRNFQHVATTTVDGFAVTTPSETVATLAGGLRASQLEVLVDECLAARRFEISDLMSTIDRCRGVTGIKKLRIVAADRLPDAYQPPTTVLESLLYRLLDNSDIPPAARQFPFPREVMPGTVDAYVPLWRLIVEADGRRWHTRKADFERDRVRDNAAAARGIGVLRFTYRMLTVTPDECRATILETGKARTRTA